jgi:hypothetical protein
MALVIDYYENMRTAKGKFHHGVRTCSAILLRCLPDLRSCGMARKIVNSYFVPVADNASVQTPMRQGHRTLIDLRSETEAVAYSAGDYKTSLIKAVKKLMRSNWTVLILFFVLTRGLALYSGMRYHIAQTALFWQFLDIDLLQHHLLRVMLHLHAQPPLLNVAVGVAEKIAGPNYGSLLLSFQFLLGLAAVISFYLLLTRLRVASMVGFCLSLVLLLNPAEIYFEFHSLYTSWVLAFHCFVALATVCYVQSRSQRALCWVVGLAVLLTLLRSSYQWIWVVALLGLLWWQLPGNRRQIRNAGFVGLFLALLWPAKNYVLFRHFTSSTWGPYSISKHWFVDRPPDDSYLKAGELPSLTYTGLDDPELQRWLTRYWSVPPSGARELDDVAKFGGATNWNSLAMLRLHDAKAKDISFLLHHDPKAYVTGVGRAIKLFFEPPSVWLAGFADPEQYSHIARYDGIVRRICCNLFGIPRSDEPGTSQSAPSGSPHGRLTAILQSLCVGALLTCALVVLFVLSLARLPFWDGSLDRKVSAMAMTVTISYAFAVVNLVEIGENMRFRFETEALVLAVSAIFLQQLWDRRKLRGRSKDGLGHLPLRTTHYLGWSTKTPFRPTIAGID